MGVAMGIDLQQGHDALVLALVTTILGLVVLIMMMSGQPFAHPTLATRIANINRSVAQIRMHLGVVLRHEIHVHSFGLTCDTAIEPERLLTDVWSATAPGCGGYTSAVAVRLRGGCLDVVLMWNLILLTTHLRRGCRCGCRCGC